MKRNFSQLKGFTLIELLVVVAIIALLMAILLPSLSAARAQAKNVYCASNIRSWCVAELMYADQNTNYLPIASADDDLQPGQNYYGVLAAENLVPKNLTIDYSRLPFGPTSGVYFCPSEYRAPVAGCETYYLQNRFSAFKNVRVKTSQIVNPARTVLITDAMINPWQNIGYSFWESGNLSTVMNINANRHQKDTSRNYGQADGHVELADRFKVANGLFQWEVLDWYKNVIEK